MFEQCSRVAEAALPGFKSWLCLSLAGDLEQVPHSLQLPAPFSCLENKVSQRKLGTLQMLTRY